MDGNWTGNKILDFVLQLLFIIIVIVLVVWAIKEVAPIFTDSIYLPHYEVFGQ